MPVSSVPHAAWFLYRTQSGRRTRVTAVPGGWCYPATGPRTEPIVGASDAANLGPQLTSEPPEIPKMASQPEPADKASLRRATLHVGPVEVVRLDGKVSSRASI